MSIKESYNKWAVQYDNNVNATRDLDHKATVNTLNRYQFSDVVELGCGTGKNTSFLLTKASTIVGIDFSTEMLAKAKQKISNKNVLFRQGDITQPWGVEDHSVDLVTASLVLEHISDLKPVFEQAAKKLRAGGLLFISELHPYKQYTGSKARFETEQGIQTLEAYTHHTSEYLTEAKASGFKLVELKEWFDEIGAPNIPRLISFVFKDETDFFN